MQPDEIKQLLAQKPGPTLAFAPENSSAETLADTLAAFANAGGGILLMGVSEKGRLKGLDDPENALDTAISAAFFCDPALIIPLPELIDLDEVTVLAVEVPAGLPHVYQAGQHYLLREGASNVTLSTRQLRRLMLERGQTSFERTIAAEARLFDLDWQRVITYVNDVPTLMADSEEEALLKRACMVKDSQGNFRLTNAGLLLFGHNPGQFIPSAEIIVVRYQGLQMSDQFIREDITGPLPDQIRQAEAFVARHLERSHHLDGLARTEYSAFPLDAIREIIVNAVAHRAYDIGGDSIRIFVFSDRLECYSPGRLPGHVTVDNILTERFSRNEAIVQVLSDMGYIERLGYGIDRIVRRMAEEGLAAPKFEETTAGFKVTLYSRPQDWLSSQPVSDTVRGWLAQGLNERQISAMNFVMDNGRIANSDYSDLCPHVSTETLRRDLSDLVERDMLLRVGEKRATYYILK